MRHTPQNPEDPDPPPDIGRTSIFTAAGAAVGALLVLALVIAALGLAWFVVMVLSSAKV